MRAASDSDVTDALAQLPDDERAVVEARFGINGFAYPRTLAWISGETGVGVERVIQLQLQGQRRLASTLP